MKNSIRLLFSVAVLMLALPFLSHAQEVSPAISGGFFAKIKDWVTGNLLEMAVVMISTLMGKWGVTKVIKSIAHRGSIVLKELGELSTDTAILLEKIDNAINDDNTIKQNSIKEVLDAGRDVVAELNDVKIIFKPKT